ncbi:hypothetical protein [Streptomyces griseorubiginosus]|uniref:hypothetical protein n=1 Tax=Streptomyces griseorubiginosus TaxID=67304 RepID=UPI0036ECB7D7
MLPGPSGQVGDTAEDALDLDDVGGGDCRPIPFGPGDEPLILKLFGPAAWLLQPTALGT